MTLTNSWFELQNRAVAAEVRVQELLAEVDALRARVRELEHLVEGVRQDWRAAERRVAVLEAAGDKLANAAFKFLPGGGRLGVASPTETFYPGKTVRVEFIRPGERIVTCLRCWGYGWEPKLTTIDVREACRDCHGEGRRRG